MKKYVKVEMEVVEFDAKDVIMTSGCSTDVSVDVGGWECGNEGGGCWDFVAE